MDAGKIGDTQYCPPQLLAFDLDTDRVVYRHIVNASNYIATSLFITPVSEELASNLDTDNFEYCLIVNTSNCFAAYLILKGVLFSKKGWSERDI